MSDPTAIINEIKVLLQEELMDVRESVAQTRLNIVELRGDIVLRSEFQRALDSGRDKREALQAQVTLLQTEVAKMATMMKIYISIATAVSGIVGSGIGAIIFSGS